MPKNAYISWFVTTQNALPTKVVLKDDNGKEYFSAKKQNYLNTSIDPPLALGTTFFTGSKLTLTIDVDTKYELKGKPTLIDITDDNGNIVGIGTVSSGLTDELRADFAKHPEKYLNRVVSLQCMEKSIKDHTLRHAFFKGFRDDKNPKDCSLNTIF